MTGDLNQPFWNNINPKSPQKYHNKLGNKNKHRLNYKLFSLIPPPALEPHWSKPTYCWPVWLPSHLPSLRTCSQALVRYTVKLKLALLHNRQENQENLRKILETINIIIMAMFVNFMERLYLNNRFNGLIDFPASDWYYKIPISLFSKLDILMISGFPKPWKPVFIRFVTPECFNKSKKMMGTSWTILFL